jgi:excinuclease ABC subunit C
MRKSDLTVLELPDTPGCYFFRDAENNILYIGKATSLRSRVRSYFDPDLIETRGLKIVNMVQAATTVTYQESQSVLEALILEAKLIKEHQPYFNTKEKDDKSFYSILITKEEYPRVLLMRTRDIEKKFPVEMQKQVFGPFTSGASIKVGLKIIRKIFPFRDRCMPGVGTACFNAQIGLCPGMCANRLTPKEYAVYVKNLVLFFEGHKGQLEKSLEKQMNAFAKELRFEEAGQIKKTLYAINHIRDIALIKEEVSELSEGMRIESYDAAHISGTSRVGVCTVVQDGRMAPDEYRKFKLVEGINNDVAAYAELLARRFKHTEWQLPQIVLVDGGLPQKNTAETVLKNLGLSHIDVVSVIKDERHKPKAFLGKKTLIEKHKKELLLANSEAHRFAIAYHKLLRGKQVKGK